MANATETSGDCSKATAAQAQHAALGLDTAKHSVHTVHPQAQWFPKASLGLFIHWGIASVHGNLDLSWAMIANTPWDAAAGGANKLTPEAYWKLAERFKPELFDPDKWIAAAAAAGFQYAVMTTMHHDGYTLWPSRYGDFGVQTYLPGRDLVGEFVQACRRHGLKVGLYYSPPDWRFDRQYMSFNFRNFGNTPAAQSGANEFPALDQRHQPTVVSAPPADHAQLRRKMFHGRVEELLTRYGHIDLLWFDGGAHDNELRDRARALQPHLVINSRSCDGDFDCTECELPEQRPTGWFETCHCWQSCDILRANGAVLDVWGYLAGEKFKSTAWMLGALSLLRGWGANLLVNVGPRPDGQLPDVVYERLAETAQWMAHSRRSVIGVEPCPDLRCEVPVTADARSLYVHLTPGHSGKIDLVPIDKPQSVRLLRTGLAVPYTWDDQTLHLEVPADQRTSLVDVVMVESMS